MTPVKPLVSIIIVVKNDRGIRDTLRCLYTEKTRTAFEVLVVDASEPSRLADIRAQFPKVRWDQFPVSTRRTTPEQRNRGIELARGSIIAFIDSNCVPAPGWVDAIAAAITSGEDIVCGPVLDSSPRNLVHYAPSHSQGRYIDECTTISVGISRAVLDTIGGFDESFSFGQDIDFFWRAKDAGYQIYYDPAVSISHDWGERTEQLSRAYQYGKARAHLFRKHWPRRWKQLAREPHVWIYPLFILSLPLTYFLPVYPLLIFVPFLKNVRQHPVGLVLHHLVFALGVLVGTFTHWPKITIYHAADKKASLQLV